MDSTFSYQSYQSSQNLITLTANIIASMNFLNLNDSLVYYVHTDGSIEMIQSCPVRVPPKA